MRAPRMSSTASSVSAIPSTFPIAGTFYWQAAYSGDINNAPATSACTDEVLTVTTPDINGSSSSRPTTVRSRRPARPSRATS